jgi:1-acyl-sn-glycerol-3-phosphate acyltransferase
LGALVRLVLIRANPYKVIRAINHLTNYLMRAFTAIAGIHITVSGKKETLKENGLFIISTHTGYLDGVILGNLVPGSFITKNEIKKTPFLGKVVSIGSSIFIDRTRKNYVVQYLSEMTDRLKNGINIFNFPEGHATDGSKILSFFAAFFDAPIKAEAAIVPVTIDYTHVNGSPDFNRDKVYCYGGKVGIIEHLWNFLKLKTINVTVTVHEKIMPNGHHPNSKARKLVSKLCMQRLSQYKNLSISDEPISKRFSAPPTKI